MMQACKVGLPSAVAQALPLLEFEARKDAAQVCNTPLHPILYWLLCNQTQRLHLGFIETSHLIPQYARDLGYPLNPIPYTQVPR